MNKRKSCDLGQLALWANGSSLSFGRSFVFGSDAVVPTTNDVKTMPQPHTTDPKPTSGCDSSNCSYCQTMARRQSLSSSTTPTSTATGGEPANFCWLRQKRSTNDLLDIDTNTATAGVQGLSLGLRSASSASLLVVPDLDGPTQPTSSIWDHALLEATQQQQAVPLAAYNIQTAVETVVESRPSIELKRHKGSPPPEPQTTWRAWRTLPEFASRPDPVPAAFHPVAHFTAAMPATTTASGKDNSNSPQQCAEITCAVEFESHGWLVATAGVAKQIRVYSLASYLGNDTDSSNTNAYQHPIRTHRMSSKLSSLCWSPDAPGVVTVGDYDGVVSQLDLESGHLIAEADQHKGRRVWSVSHSHFKPNLVASASDDGCVKLWEGAGLSRVASAITPGAGAAVCSVQLSPYNENLVSLACANSNAYIYDLRKLDAPLSVLTGHSRPVSYARFLSSERLITASIDGTLASWDIASRNTNSSIAISKKFYGHTNHKNFCGLSIHPEQALIACGSELPAVYAYSLNWEPPIVEHKFSLAATSRSKDASPSILQQQQRPEGQPETGAGISTSSEHFCSAVCWQPDTSVDAMNSGPLLAAATTDGSLHVLSLKQKLR